MADCDKILIVKMMLERVSQTIKSSREKAINEGWAFNIFSICGIEHLELKHSNMLAVLLDPKGLHGQGTLYLDCFVQMVANKIKQLYPDSKRSFDFKVTENTEVRREYKNIDLFLVDNKRAIIIENKIHALDGDGQVKAYVDKISKDRIAIDAVIYLTPFGRELSEKSWPMQEREDHNLLNLSYHTDIVDWLEVCLDATKKNSNVSLNTETQNIFYSLRQYLDCVKEITNQGENNVMRKKIWDEALESEDAFKAAKCIATEIGNNPVARLWDEQKRKGKNVKVVEHDAKDWCLAVDINDVYQLRVFQNAIGIWMPNKARSDISNIPDNTQVDIGEYLNLTGILVNGKGDDCDVHWLWYADITEYYMCRLLAQDTFLDGMKNFAEKMVSGLAMK